MPLQRNSHEELERRLRDALVEERDPWRLERLSSALAELLRSRSALTDAEEEARHMLGDGPERAAERLTLHEAIARVLADRGEPMRTSEIRDAVNRRGLYRRKKDGNPVGTAQVAARVNNYRELFRKLGDGRVELKNRKQEETS